MKRRVFLKGLGLSTAVLAIPGGLSAFKRLSSQGPRAGLNVVVILVDDLGWMDTGCYGSRRNDTPNIDRLAGQGMKFTDGYAACAVCSPTRAAVMTGRYPARIGVTDWIHFRDFKGDRSDPDQKSPTEYVGDRSRRLLCPPNPYWMELDEVTIAEMLKAAGYVSCHVGKWHLGPDAWYPDRQGFDLNIAGCDIGTPPSYFDPYFREGWGRIPTLEPRSQGEYLTDREADEAVRFIREHSDRPFFLYMAHYAVHTPLQGKQDLVEKYEAREHTLWDKPVYSAMVESVDQAVGRIMAALDESNLAENTLVIFTSDNGGLMSVTRNAPLRGGKGYPYEGGIRVPLIVRWPGVVEAGSVCSEPVTSIDFFPTICEAAGVDLPSDRVIDGRSMVPLLSQTGTLEREAIYWHFPHYRDRIGPYSIVRADEWKLIKRYEARKAVGRYEGKAFELFNIKDDLSERHDLSGQLPKKVRELDKMLTSWLKATGAKLPKKNRRYVPS
ncbi:MAG: sulfatase [Fidelibacterota bacterium]|nr:MAG: sulfatase [Candidatus Neomarinimicrobiota bacterium]